MKGRILKPGDLVSIFYRPGRVVGEAYIDKTGVITNITGYKASVLLDGEIEVWHLSDLKKMSAQKRAIDESWR